MLMEFRSDRLFYKRQGSHPYYDELVAHAGHLNDLIRRANSMGVERQTLYFELVRYIYNTFISNHTLIDGNKRAYYIYSKQLGEMFKWDELL